MKNIRCTFIHSSLINIKGTTTEKLGLGREENWQSIVTVSKTNDFIF